MTELALGPRLGPYLVFWCCQNLSLLLCRLAVVFWPCPVKQQQAAEKWHDYPNEVRQKVDGPPLPWGFVVLCHMPTCKSVRCHLPRDFKCCEGIASEGKEMCLPLASGRGEKVTKARG